MNIRLYVYFNIVFNVYDLDLWIYVYIRFMV